MTVRGKQIPWWAILATGLTIMIGLTTLGIVTPGWATKAELAEVDDKAKEAQSCCENLSKDLLENQRRILRRLDHGGRP